MCFRQLSEEPGIERQAAEEEEEEAATVAFQPDWCDSAPAGPSTALRNHHSASRRARDMDLCILTFMWICEIRKKKLFLCKIFWAVVLTWNPVSGGPKATASLSRLLDV